MVAELELNSVIPSPDTIEEVRKSLGLNPPRQSLIHDYSTISQEITVELKIRHQPPRNGLMSLARSDNERGNEVDTAFLRLKKS